MNTQSSFTRRRFLQLAAVGTAATTLQCLAATPSFAAGTATVRVTDLGPAVMNFSLAAAIPVGDTAYIASRNIEPMQIVGYDLATEKVTTITAGPGISTQTIAADPDGHYLYAVVKERASDPGPGFFRIDLTDPAAPKEDIASIGSMSPYAIAMAPDGKLFYGGQEPQPKLSQYDPATGEITVVAVPDPDVPMIRSLYATEDRVYIGTGASLGATPTSTRAGLFVLDRASGEVTSILPPEFAGGVELRDIAVYDDTLYACGTTPQGAAVALIDVADPTTYTLMQGDRSFLRLPRKLGTKLYMNGRALIELDLETGAFREITLEGKEFGEIWGLWIRGEKVMVVSAFGLIFEYDPATGQAKEYDLIAGGAPAGPQLAMSVAASVHGVYTGGTNAVTYRDLRNETQTRILATSEAKDVLIRGRVGYFAQYNDIGILAHDPRIDGEWTRNLATLPPSQNRPHQIVWDDVNQLALIGLQSDTKSGGSLMTFDPETNATTAAINPIDEAQMVRAVATHDGIAYLGGQTVGNGGGTVVAWDPIAQRELWRLTPQAKPTGVTGLAVLGGMLYVMCHRGDFFVIDLTTRAIVHSAKHGAVTPNYGTLLVSRGRVYGTSSRAFVSFDPKTFARTDLVTLDGEWYGIPRSAVDERGRFYAIQKRNLVRIELS